MTYELVKEWAPPTGYRTVSADISDDGTVIVVGCLHEDDGSEPGKAFLLVNDDEAVELVSPDSFAGDYFGGSVIISSDGSTIAVKAFRVGPYYTQTAVYIYSGSTFNTLVSDDENDLVPTSLSASGATLLVAVPGPSKLRIYGGAGWVDMDELYGGVDYAYISRDGSFIVAGNRYVDAYRVDGVGWATSTDINFFGIYGVRYFTKNGVLVAVSGSAFAIYDDGWTEERTFSDASWAGIVPAPDGKAFVTFTSAAFEVYDEFGDFVDDAEGSFDMDYIEAVSAGAAKIVTAVYILRVYESSGAGDGWGTLL